MNRAILLLVRSVEYRNLPLGVIWMSAAQTFGLSSFGAAAAGAYYAPGCVQAVNAYGQVVTPC